MRFHVVALTLCTFAGDAFAADPPKQWNVLVITADDMNADSCGWNGNKLGATPNLDAFAKTSHRFVNSHVTVSICQPSRSALMTGRVPHRNGALGFSPIRRDVPTLVEVLRDNGYYTAVIAKAVHMAPAEKFPWHATGEQSLGKQPTKFAERFREMLATVAKEKKPFFINANICDPHRPFIGPTAKADELDGAKVYKPNEVTVPAFLEDLPRVREEVAQYYSTVSRFDVAFGLVMKELTAAGRDSDTIVVFMSDHGMSFPFSKATVYYNGTWSPLLIRIPGMKEPQTRTEFVSSVDVMPSVLELLAFKTPAGMDGRSWLPLLKGESQPDRDFVVTHVNTVSSGMSFAQRCIRTKDRALLFHAWVGGKDKFSVEAMGGLSFAAMNTSAEAGIQARVKQLVEGEKLMLFDITSDPTERKNVIKDPKYANDLVELSKKLLAHMKRTEDPQMKAFEAAIDPRPELAVPGAPANVRKVLDTLCVSCHGPAKSKGKITVHDLDGRLSSGHDVERWERVLKMLRNGEMPPEEAKQPSDTERKAVGNWIEAGLNDYARIAGATASVPTARRLTNFEYQNTMRDLLGFELNLIENLPEDPVKPYRFNNTAEMMLIGPEQMDRYTENARRAMASAIVDPEKPKVHRTVQTWIAKGLPEPGLQNNELGIYGNRRNTVSTGMSLKSWPATGEFRIRVKASANLPEGYHEMPLRLIMGSDLFEAGSTARVKPVGTMQLRNTPDKPMVFEFRGRIENYPTRPARELKGVLKPPIMAITPQNLFDDGRLGDHVRGVDPLRALQVPRPVIDFIEFEAPLVDVWPPEHHTRILFESPLRKTDLNAYVREVLQRFTSRAFRRPATADELDRLMKIYKIYAAEFDTFEKAMRETLAMVLISPQFLFHTPAEKGKAKQQYELASRLSYFLWGSMPDAELMELASQGRLDDAAVVKTQVERLLADGRARAFIDNFTTQWLSLGKMKAVKINAELFPRFLYLINGGEQKGTEMPYRPTIRDFLHEETVGFVAELIRRNAGVSNIVDSDFAFLNQPLAAHYGVDGVEGYELRPVAIKPEHQLGGLLTHGSVLVGNSTGSAPHPIYRAVWLREAILGDEVKPPPAEVPALSDTAGEASAKAVLIKDLLRKHRKETSCNECHARLDPWGIPFEQYNATGRFQPKVPKPGVRVRGLNPAIDKDLAAYAEYLKTINTVEVPADSVLSNGRTIDGMQELKAYLLKERQDEIARAVLCKFLAYGIGRELTFRDRVAVDRLLEESKKNGFKLRDMIVSICQSETFQDSNPKGK